MIFGLSREERHARWLLKKERRIQWAKPTKVFAWYPVRRAKDNIRAAIDNAMTHDPNCRP